MISTFFSTRNCLSTRAWAIAGSIALLACGGRNALAQSSALSPGFLEHPAVTPPLLFREVWQQPPHTGPLNDENRRITQQAVTNPDWNCGFTARTRATYRRLSTTASPTSGTASRPRPWH